MAKYPSVDDIIHANAKVLAEVKVKKADLHEVLSKRKISEILEGVAANNGDLYDKAAQLLKGLLQAHPFASGNRRTAFAVAQNFLLYNGAETKVNDKENAYIFQGIREGYYTDNEIKQWLMKGEIREFKRK